MLIRYVFILKIRENIGAKFKEIAPPRDKVNVNSAISVFSLLQSLGLSSLFY